MKKDDSVYLKDIWNAIDKIDRYMKGINLENFQSDDMRQDAVIRQLEIIGEAANKISDYFLKNNKDFPINEAVRMRNFLIHGYDEVDIKVVWKTITDDIPFLKEKIKQLL
ncbi:MAG: DUF86 domain-containing protein [Patescibacteria group bacterium]